MIVARCGSVSTTGVVAAGLLFSALGALRCSENPVPARSDPCSSVYQGSCGAACTVDGECAAGLHCSAGACTAQCAPGASLCGADQVCSDSGRCTEPSASGSGGGLDIDASATGGTGGLVASNDACAAIELQLGDVTPSVVLLIDQSRSMIQADIEPGGANRWEALKEALTGPGSIIQTLESRVRFGFAFYSNHAGLDMPPAEGVCPTLDTGGAMAPLMPPALDRFAAFSAYFTPLQTFNNTPTAESFELVAAELAAFAEPGPKYIVLATDGDPDRCENDNENVDDVSKQMVVDAVQNAHDNLAISTFVISVGGDVAAAHLNDVANVGQGFPVDDPMDRFFLVNTQDALTAAFETIVAGVRSCSLGLNGEIDPALASSGQVTVDGMPLAMDPDNGWQVVDGTTIELRGTACDAVKMGTLTLKATFPCEAVLVVPK